MARIGGAAIAALLATAATVAIAQSVNDEPTDANGVDALRLPRDITVFGPSDPAVRKATAIINGAIVTDTDVDQRLALVVAANGGKVAPEEQERLKLQVLRNIIDETLQIQEAAANKIVITPDEVQQTFERVARSFKQSPKDFVAYLRGQGSSETSMKRQIEGELAWRRLLGRRVEPFIAVGEDEVNAVIGRLNAAKGSEEYRVGEIFLSSTPETANDTLANANRIMDQIRKGASFVAYARQFSEASTAAVGGDLGWVRAEQLPDPMAVAVKEMQPGQISQPVPLPGGYSIIALIDKRQVLTADPRDAVLSLKQVSITFPKGQTREQATPRVEAFANAMRTVQGCGKVADVAAGLGGEVVDNDQVRIRDLPPQLQEIVLKLSIGQATPPFGSAEEGVRSLVLCGRDDPAASGAPSYDQIYSQMEEERVNRRARRYLRDLRRDAVIEYR